MENWGTFPLKVSNVKCEPIFIIFVPLRRELNFQQNPSNISHFNLMMVPHYLRKFKILICLKTTAYAHCDQVSEYVVRK